MRHNKKNSLIITAKTRRYLREKHSPIELSNFWQQSIFEWNVVLLEEKKMKKKKKPTDQSAYSNDAIEEEEASQIIIKLMQSIRNWSDKIRTIFEFMLL